MSMSRTSPIPTQRCRRCDYPLTDTTYFHGQRQPEAGNVSICIECGLVQIFSADLTLRDPTPEERLELDQSQQFLDVQMAQAYVQGGKHGKRRQDGSNR